MATAYSPDSPTLSNARRGVRTLDVIALILLIIGGLNWALVGLFQLDLVAAIFGNMSMLSRIVYVLVGVAALYGFITLSHLGRRD